MSDINKYISMRNNGKYELEWFYSYYLENGGKRANIEDFQVVLNSINLQEVLDFLDIKFKLTKIYDVNNKLIKVFR